MPTPVQSGKRLWFGFAGLLGLVGLLLVVALWSLEATVTSEQRLSAAFAGRVQRVEALRLGAEQLISRTREDLLSRDEVSAERLRATRSEFERRLEDLQEDEARGALREVVEGAAAYLDVSAELSRREGAAGDAAVRYWDAQVRPRSERLAEALERWASNERLAFVTAQSEARRRRFRIELALILSGAGALLLGLGLAVTTARKVSRHLAAEHEATERANLALGARSQMMSVVSHDLRNPLATAVLATARLRERLRGDPGAERTLAQLQNAEHRMQKLIELVLDEARLERGGLHVSLQGLAIQDALGRIQRLFELQAEAAGVSLQVSAGASGVVVADPDRLQQILENLVGNALRHTPRGGAISVDVAEADAAGFWELTVRDTGEGMSEDQLERLFGQERVPSGTSGGLGLGLKIARGLVELQGGRIWAESRSGQGTAVHFTLPTLRPRSTAEAAQAVAGSRPH